MHEFGGAQRLQPAQGFVGVHIGIAVAVELAARPAGLADLGSNPKSLGQGPGQDKGLARKVACHSLARTCCRKT